MRESRDSNDNPESNAIMINLDVTGSMGFVAESIARTELNTLCTAIFDKAPVKDPHIMCAGVGDVESDRAPLQVTQFEADIRISDQLEQIWLEGNGGGNSYESYILPWYFAATKTYIDCFEKRQRKGYLFTIGDERPTPRLKKSHLERVFGTTIEKDYTAPEVLEMVKEKWHVFHLIAEEGNWGLNATVREEWAKLLGQRVIRMPNHKNIAETIVTAIMVNEGMDIDEAAEAWKDETVEKILKCTINFRK
jgi:hypothetical protein